MKRARRCRQIGRALAARAGATAALAVLAVTIACVGSASAGEYTVSSGSVFGCANSAWDHVASSSLYQSYDRFCIGNSSPDDISAAINQSGGRSYANDQATSTFHAPAGTWISSADISWSDGVDLNHNFGVGFHYVDGNGAWHNFAECVPNSSNCTIGSEVAQGTWPGSTYNFPAGTSLVGDFAVCDASWCDHTPENGNWSQAWVEIHSAQVTVHEDVTPGIGYTGGGMVSGKWLRGTQDIDFNSSDPSGIQRAQLKVDGGVAVDTGGRGCDYTRPVPCSNISGGSLWLDTGTLTNGQHSFTVATENAAGNWAETGSSPLNVDNSAPGEIGSPAVAGGQGWHTTNSFSINWTNPADAAPITTAYYEICDASGQNCSQGNQGGQGINHLSGIQVPQAGVYKLRVWVADAAGNVASAKSPFLTLEYDGTDPGPARPQYDNGWVNAAQATAYREKISPPSPLPPSGIVGYAVTTDGSDPGTTVTAQADSSGVADYAFGELREGSTTLKARAISGSGVASSQVGQAIINVDKTPPATSVSGAPDPNTWSRTPESISIAATDALSGMSPADAADPNARDGAYIQYSIDGGSSEIARGARAAVGVSDDGSHSISYQSFDLAGNGSPEQTIYFKIDKTAPVAGFEAQDTSDPSRVSVLASDTTSGLADGGTIEIRRVGTPGWMTLPTTRDGARYYAHVDPATTPPGAYEAQAMIPDQAGNVATVSTLQSGGPEQITIDGCRVNGVMDPACAAAGGLNGSGGSNGAGGGGVAGGAGAYTAIDNLYQFEIAPNGRPYDDGATVGTEVHAGIVSASVKKRVANQSKCGSTRRRASRTKPKKCKRPAKQQTVTSLVPKLTVKFGQGATVRGSVMTSDRHPLADIDVLVLQRYDAAGMRYSLLRTVTTDAAGAFAYVAPRGASRTITFLFRGSSVYRHSTASVDLTVPAAATIRANKKALRNGQSVAFTGAILGTPYPSPGKLVTLQAFYRGRWRTFATPRADTHGRYHYSYRFGATHGVVVYRFRAAINQEAAYPYLLGFSSAIRVKVTG